MRNSIVRIVEPFDVNFDVYLVGKSSAMAWQFEIRRDVADVAILGWVQEQMHSLSDLEILGSKFGTISDKSELISIAFWNPEYRDKSIPEVPQGKWTCHLIADGSFEEVLQEAVDRLDSLEQQSHEAAFHAKLVVTPGKDRLGRVAFYSPPADAKLIQKTPEKTFDTAISDLVAEQRLFRTMFTNVSRQVEGLAAEVETIKSQLKDT